MRIEPQCGQSITITLSSRFQRRQLHTTVPTNGEDWFVCFGQCLALLVQIVYQHVPVRYAIAAIPTTGSYLDLPHGRTEHVGGQLRESTTARRQQRRTLGQSSLPLRDRMDLHKGDHTGSGCLSLGANPCVAVSSGDLADPAGVRITSLCVAWLA